MYAMKSLRGWYAFVLFFVCCRGQRNTVVSIENNNEEGVYGNLLVAIQKDVPENETIIEQLKVS